MKMKKKMIWIGILLTGILNISAFAMPPEHEYFIDHHDQVEKVTYRLYMPEDKSGPVPVVVCIGGVALDAEGNYAQSGSDECFEEPWYRFADQNKVAILGLGFLHVNDDWLQQESYQFPKAWSGRALLKILELLKEDNNIDPEQLYLTGVSAGAQFSIRFAQMRPDIAKAVAAHAAGGYDDPEGYIPVKFLVTVGEFDTGEISRLEFAKIFAEMAKEAGIDIEFHVMPGIGHTWSGEQREMSREFFEKILKESRKEMK